MCIRDSFNDTDLTGARLDGARLAGADFGGATLLKARLDGATLTGARLEGTDLRRAVLTRAEVSDVVVSSLRARGAVARRLEGASPELEALLEAEGAKLGYGFLGEFLEGLKKRRVEKNLQSVDSPESAGAVRFEEEGGEHTPPAPVEAAPGERSGPVESTAPEPSELVEVASPPERTPEPLSLIHI